MNKTEQKKTNKNLKEVMLGGLKKNMIKTRYGFSAAEMLIVLLILSFLILALPPLVHKPVTKKITRGEHGRFECWVDPDNGNTYEFYATEKNGADPEYLDAAGNPVGKQVTECHFSPKDQAPNAAFFSFQAIGGGAGGSYPPYNPSSTTYKDDDYLESATIYLGTKCCSRFTSYRDSDEAAGRCYSSTYEEKCSDWGTYCNAKTQDGKPSAFATSSDEEASCYNYAMSLQANLHDTNKSEWLDKYWIPVPSSTNVKLCSGIGYTGSPRAEQLVPPGGSTATSAPQWEYKYGGMGGNGACWEINGSKVLLDVKNRFKIVHSNRKDVEKFFGYKPDTSDKIKYFFSWEYANGDPQHQQKPSPPVDIPQFDDGTWGLPTCFAVEKGKDPATEGVQGANTCLSPEYASDGSVVNQYWGNYANARLEEGVEDDREQAENNKNLICNVKPGANSSTKEEIYQNASSEMIQFDPAFQGAPSPTICDAPWTKVGDNTTDIAASITYPSYPSSITLKRYYGYDTPTFGYAGAPGESISMFLPKLHGDLTFEIGEAGVPGTAAAINGGNGGNTIVKSEGITFLVAKGGMGVRGGEAASKVFMFGEDVFRGRVEGTKRNGENDVEAPAVTAICEQALPSNDPTTWVIDGCLDKTVARDAEKRFAEDSGFYTVLELDANTRTPSAINRLYGEEGTNMLPGSAGDGGYSFLRSTSGKEYVTFTNHPNNPQLEWEYEYVNDKPYTCYRKNDQIGHPTGEVVPAPDTVCKPTKGYPGAVIIVW